MRRGRARARLSARLGCPVHGVLRVRPRRDRRTHDAVRIDEWQPRRIERFSALLQEHVFLHVVDRDTRARHQPEREVRPYLELLRLRCLSASSDLLRELPRHGDRGRVHEAQLLKLEHFKGVSRVLLRIRPRVTRVLVSAFALQRRVVAAPRVLGLARAAVIAQVVAHQGLELVVDRADLPDGLAVDL